MTLSLSISGIKCIIHSLSTSSNPVSDNLLLLHNDKEKDIWVDRNDVRRLIEYKEINRDNNQLDDILSNDNYDDDINKDIYEDLLYERYQDLIDNNEDNINKKIQYQSNRNEIYTKPTYDHYFPSKRLYPSNNIDIPLTRKHFDIILHTIKSIRENGKQFEILLKVKHSDNNVYFDFLNIDSNLYSLYKYLLDMNDIDFWSVFIGRDLVNDETEKQKTTTANALELLGNIYSDSDSDNDNDNATTNANLSNNIINEVNDDISISDNEVIHWCLDDDDLLDEDVDIVHKWGQPHVHKLKYLKYIQMKSKNQIENSLENSQNNSEDNSHNFENNDDEQDKKRKRLMKAKLLFSKYKST